MHSNYRTSRGRLSRLMLDLSRMFGTIITAARPTPRLASIEHDRERVRGRLALILVRILAAVIVATAAGIATAKVSVHDLKELSPILDPLVVLVGTMLGFYFGVNRNAHDRDERSDVATS